MRSPSVPGSTIGGRTSGMRSRSCARVCGVANATSNRATSSAVGVIGATDVVGKAIKSAGANLSVKLGKKLDLKQVWVTECYADQGPMKFLRRVQPGPQGRAMPFKRKMCHIHVAVSDTKGSK